MPLRRGRLNQPAMMMGAPIPLEREDLKLLLEPNRSAQGTVERLRNSHHNIARFAALGMKYTEIAQKTGYSYNRVCTLLQSPAMQELVAKYQAALTERFEAEASAFFDYAVENMVIAERMINDHLHEADETGELPKVRELLAISRDSADRFGFPKANTNVNVNTDFAAMLEQAIARSGKTIEASSPSSSLAPRSVEPVSSPEPAPLPSPIHRRA